MGVDLIPLAVGASFDIVLYILAKCYITAGTFARRGLSSTAKTLRSLGWVSRF